MQKQLIGILLVLFVLILGAYIVIYDGNTKNSTSATSANLVISEALRNSEVMSIEIRSANQTLLKASKLSNENKWMASQLSADSAYPLDKTHLAGFVQSLADAKLIEAKSKKPENHHRLGLSSVDDEGSSAHLVVVEFESGDVRMLIGNEATNQAGQYIRYADDDQMWLMDKRLSLPEEKYSWLDQSLLGFTAKELISLARTDEGKQWSLQRENLDGEALPTFRLSDFDAEEDELRFETILEDVVNNMLSLEYTAVFLLNSFEQSSLSPVAEFELVDTNQQTHNVKLFENEGNLMALFNTVGEQSYINNWIYELRDYQARELVKEYEDFLLVEPDDNEVKEQE
ncbi:DUF4340 domain-containing protein [Agaribacter flavus]|uniref:DUF4340 domain-containing protein n=1 Tax=Agaribacter flavus TaxID=1902781 RepID=A0ABV7FTH8_9ALTE